MDWEIRVEKAQAALRKAVEDYGIPDVQREAALQYLGLELKSRKIVIEDCRAPSWNKMYSSEDHWSERKNKADKIHTLVRAAIDPEDEPLKIPVDILVVAYYDHHLVDSDNIADKFFIDGLKGWLIPDDDASAVRRTTTVSAKDPAGCKVMIIVTETPGAKEWDVDEGGYDDEQF